MKKLILAICLLKTANSFAFDAQVSCETSGSFFAECSVYNHTPKQINCTVSARGITKYGEEVILYGSGPVTPYNFSTIDITTDNIDIDLMLVLDPEAKCDF